MGNISNMSPFHTTGWKCFAESWACTTFPREIDWESPSVGHECGMVVLLGVGGVAFVLVWGVCVGSISAGCARGPWVVSGLGLLLSLGSSGVLGREHFVLSYKIKYVN